MNSPIGWPGGKKNLVKTIVPLLPAHKIYVEPFCGSAKLLFAKEPSKREIISDTNSDLINFFLVSKYRPSALAEQFDIALAHPRQFKMLRNSAKGLDEVQRAFRFFYLTHFSFGSKGEHFGGPRDFLPNKRIELIRAKVEETARRLRHVVIECCDYADIIRKYDTPETLFYCDPPYVEFQGNGRYSAFKAEKLDELFHLLNTIKGKFVLSEENHPEVAKRVRGGRLKCKRVQTVYSLGSRCNVLPKTELLISNVIL